MRAWPGPGKHVALMKRMDECKARQFGVVFAENGVCQRIKPFEAGAISNW